MISLKKEECCGCRACEIICPVDAITIYKDEKKFSYPIIDDSKCIHCDKCEKVCNFTKKSEKSTIKEQHAFQHWNQDTLSKSTSGGTFTAISDIILENGGYICGSLMENRLFNVHHVLTNDKAIRDQMRGSKYVQSDTEKVFVEIEEKLREGNTVLFIGTPCQVGAVHKYLDFIKVSKDNFITVDFLCHGVGSNGMWQDHIKNLEKITKKKATNYQFREKRYGWTHTETVFYTDGTRSANVDVSRLKEFFHKNLNLRDCCYYCVYANKHRLSDITIADCWGADKYLKMYDYKGTSLLFINTDKGKEIFEILKDGKNKIIDASVIPQTQGSLNQPSVPTSSVDEFWKMYLEQGYEATINKYAIITTKQKCYIYLKRIIHRIGGDSLLIRLKNKLRGF